MVAKRSHCVFLAERRRNVTQRRAATTGRPINLHRESDIMSVENAIEELQELLASEICGNDDAVLVNQEVGRDLLHIIF